MHRTLPYSRLLAVLRSACFFTLFELHWCCIWVRHKDQWNSEHCHCGIWAQRCFVIVCSRRTWQPRHSSVLLQLCRVWGPTSFDNCVGCDIVQADHAPDGGVAQGIFHGILVRHHGRNLEEVEEGLEKEVERQEEENAQTTTCTCMDGMM